MIYEPDHAISDILVTMGSMLGYLTAPRKGPLEIPPVMAVELENASKELTHLRGYVSGLRENIMARQEEDVWNKGTVAINADFSGVRAHGPRTFKPDYRGRGDEKIGAHTLHDTLDGALGARGKAVNEVGGVRTGRWSPDAKTNAYIEEMELRNKHMEEHCAAMQKSLENVLQREEHALRCLGMHVTVLEEYKTAYERRISDLRQKNTDVELRNNLLRNERDELRNKLGTEQAPGDYLQARDDEAFERGYKRGEGDKAMEHAQELASYQQKLAQAPDFLLLAHMLRSGRIIADIRRMGQDAPTNFDMIPEALVWAQVETTGQPNFMLRCRFTNSTSNIVFAAADVASWQPFK